MYCVICRSNYLNVQDIILIPNMTLKERNFIHKGVSIRLHPVSFFPFPVIFDSALFLSLNSFSYFFSSNQISFLPFSSSFFYLPSIPSLSSPYFLPSNFLLPSSSFYFLLSRLFILPLFTPSVIHNYGWSGRHKQK